MEEKQQKKDISNISLLGGGGRKEEGGAVMVHPAHKLLILPPLKPTGLRPPHLPDRPSSSRETCLSLFPLVSFFFHFHFLFPFIPFPVPSGNP